MSTNDPQVLNTRIQELETELTDLQLLNEMVVEHGTELENELIELVETLSKVSTKLEKGEFDPRALDKLVDRPDELGQLGRAFQAMGYEVSARDRRLRMLRVVIPQGVALSAEKDYGRLLETIVVEAQKLCNADGGTLYLLTENHQLQAVIQRYDSIDLAMGGLSGQEVTVASLPLYDINGTPLDTNLITRVALTQNHVNIPNVYEIEGEEIAIIRGFDAQHNYQTKSCLTIPLTAENQTVIGVLQLANAKDRISGDIGPFVLDDVVEALVLLASAAMSGYKREESLRQEIAKLHIQIDTTRRDQEVAEISETGYFQKLQLQAVELRERRSARSKK
jgi:hypothetical protein